MRFRLEKVQQNSKYLKQDEEILQEIKNKNKTVYGHMNYINNASGYPMHKNTEVKYYSLGEDNCRLNKELKKLRSIFLWNTLL